MKVKSLRRVRLLATPWTAAYQAPPCMGFSRQEYWIGLPLPSPASRTAQPKRKLTKIKSNNIKKKKKGLSKSRDIQEISVNSIPCKILKMTLPQGSIWFNHPCVVRALLYISVYPSIVWRDPPLLLSTVLC